jgi:hypothetical protein
MKLYFIEENKTRKQDYINWYSIRSNGVFLHAFCNTSNFCTVSLCPENESNNPIVNQEGLIAVFAHCSWPPNLTRVTDLHLAHTVFGLHACCNTHVLSKQSTRQVTSFNSRIIGLSQVKYRGRTTGQPTQQNHIACLQKNWPHRPVTTTTRCERFHIQ